MQNRPVEEQKPKITVSIPWPLLLCDAVFVGALTHLLGGSLALAVLLGAGSVLVLVPALLLLIALVFAASGSRRL